MDHVFVSICSIDCQWRCFFYERFRRTKRSRCVWYHCRKSLLRRTYFIKGVSFFCKLDCMLTKRIIPCLDVKDGKTVKGVNFENLRDAGDPVELGALYSQQGADELV